MAIVDVIGTAAALSSTVSFGPQAWKIIKTRDTKDISAGMYFLTVAAFALWTLYGFILKKWPLVASNSVCFVLAAFILFMKLLPQRDKESVAQTIANKETRADK